VAEQVRANLALLEVAQEDTVHTPRQQPWEAGLAHRQRQAAEILAIAHQDVEGVELDRGTSRTKEELRLRSDGRRGGYGVVFPEEEVGG
jgi:hypothetical protein